MSIQGISTNLDCFFQISNEEQKTLWLADFKQGLNSGVQVSSRTTAEMVHVKRPYMSFNTSFGRSILVLDFSLPEEPRGDILLNMNGAADAYEDHVCGFKLDVNGEYVKTFHTVDTYTGANWRGDTHISIPLRFFHRGENHLEITIMGKPGQHKWNEYPAYMLFDISMTTRKCT